MKGAKAFLDTNVLLYALAQDDPRCAIAERLLAQGGVIGVQTLNEFVSVAMRKLSMPWADFLDAVGVFRALCPSPRPLTVEIHDRDLHIAGRYGYHMNDSLIVATALQARCGILYSEDLQDGQVIERLTIRNPLAARR